MLPVYYPVVYQDSFSPPGPLAGALEVGGGLVDLVRGLGVFLRLLRRFSVSLDEEGTVILVHEGGAGVRFRADGNLDVVGARNVTLSSQQWVLVNCKHKDLEKGPLDLERFNYGKS